MQKADEIDAILSTPMDDATLLDRMTAAITLGGKEAVMDVIMSDMTEDDKVRLAYALVMSVPEPLRSRMIKQRFSSKRPDHMNN